MKTSLLFVTVFILAVTGSKAQIVYPTNREIFNFSVGDTFIYNYWRYTGDLCDMTAPNPSFECSHDYYVVITGKSFSLDSNTVYYTYVNGGYSSYLPFSFPSSYSNLDSPVILAYIDTGTYDTTYIDSSNYCTPRKVGSKSNFPGTVSDFFDSVFESGLGLVGSFYQHDEGSRPDGDYSFQLLYYHKDSIICGSYEPSMLLSSVNQLAPRISVKLFPNPANNLLQIEGLSTNEQYSIYDETGRACQSGLCQNQIGIDKLLSGIYFIKFGDGGNALYEKFIKQ